MARKTTEINASSLADIAFLLLIFFLVTTTMDTDMGITRKLPPLQDQPDDSKTPPIKEKNVFVVLINKNNDVLVEGNPMAVSELKKKTKEFILNPSNNENLSEKKEIEVNLISGKVYVSKGVVSLQNDRGTEYGRYIEVQNELVAAFNELKDEFAMRKFGKHYEDLKKDKQKAIRKVIPLSISEAEPRNVGGK